MDRQPISKFLAMTINPQRPTDKEAKKRGFSADTIVFRNLETGEIVAQIHADDLFDVDGNRFHSDA